MPDRVAHTLTVLEPAPITEPLSAPPGPPPFPDMSWVPGGTYRMGSDRHYPEEAPAHPVTVDGFWMDRHPVTNEAFARFVERRGTSPSRRSPPIRPTIPVRCPRCCMPPRSCSTSRRCASRCATCVSGGSSAAARSGVIRSASTAPSTGWSAIRSSTWPTATPRRTRGGRARNCRPRRSGSVPRAAASRTPSTRGATS